MQVKITGFCSASDCIGLSKKMFENEPPSYSRLKTTVRRHIGQTMRTRNFRVRNEIVERGTVTKGQKGKKASAERKVGEYPVESNWTMYEGRLMQSLS